MADFEFTCRDNQQGALKWRFWKNYPMAGLTGPRYERAWHRFGSKGISFVQLRPQGEGEHYR